MVELPKTQEELQTLIDDSVNKAVQDLTNKHNNEMANLRLSHKKEIEKINAQSNLSAEEKAKALAEEREQETLSELNELRAYKKTSVLKEKLTKEGLPSYFANDNRLLTAEDGDLDKTIKAVKKEYEESLPKGPRQSTVVQTSVNKVSKDTKEQLYEETGEAIAQAILGR